MTNLETILIPIVANLALTIGAGVLLWMYFKDFEKRIRAEISRAEGTTKAEVWSATTAILEHAEGSRKAGTEALAQAVEASRQAITCHLSEHAAELKRTAEDVTAHARQIIDAGHQQRSHAPVQRAKCGNCDRTVYKFERDTAGNATCIDCLSRSGR
jgi:hypothetical protein